MIKQKELLAALDAIDCSLGIYKAERDKDGIIQDFRVLYVNDAVCRSFGVSKQDQVGRLLYQDVMPSHDMEVRAAQVRVANTGVSETLESRMFQNPAVREADPTYMIYRVHLHQYQDGFVAIGYDATP